MRIKLRTSHFNLLDKLWDYCARLSQTITSFMHWHAVMVLSNWADWINDNADLVKESLIGFGWHTLNTFARFFCDWNENMDFGAIRKSVEGQSPASQPVSGDGMGEFMYGEVQVNKFEQVHTWGHANCEQTEWQADRHDWKHYLPTALYPVGNNTCLQCTSFTHLLHSWITFFQFSLLPPNNFSFQKHLILGMDSL